MLHKMKKKLCLLLALAMLLVLLPAQVIATATDAPTDFTIVNPYEDVDWSTYGQYRAAMHLHTTRSDGAATLGETVLDLYNKGFDIVAVTDHDVLNSGNWADGGPGALTESQRDAVTAGTFGRTAYSDFVFPGDFNDGELYRPQANGMIPIPFTNEQSLSDHINTFWADFNNAGSGWTMARVLGEADEAGGLAIINHPGRYTTGAAGNIISSNNPIRISQYVELFDRYNSAIGFELFNRLDNESRSDRVMWDNVLMELMPYGRFVWGSSSDDSHEMNQAGYNWNVLLMPTLTEQGARTALQTGAFYMVTRVNRGLGTADPVVNATLPDGSVIPTGGMTDTLFMLKQSAPSISNIVVDGNTIAITGLSTGRIEWVADGLVIHVGDTIDVAEHWQSINNNYVRAQLVNGNGVAMTQPFGVLPAGVGFLERQTADNLSSFDPVRNINADFGVQLSNQGFRLPATVVVVSERSWRVRTPVVWDLSQVAYDPLEDEALQILTIPGTAALPDGWTNTGGLSLNVEVQVTVGINPVITLAEANAMPVGEEIVVEGFVTAGRFGGAGTPDVPNIVIQDSMDPWGGLWVNFPVAAGATVEQTHGNIGHWIRVVGTRGVQWSENNSIVATSIERLNLTPEELAARPVIVPVDLTLTDFPWGTSGQWNNMLVSFTAPLLQRNTGADGLAELHRFRVRGEGLVEVAAAGEGILPLGVAAGDMVHVDRAIIHWRADLESHRLHANWAGVGGVIRPTVPVELPFTDVGDTWYRGHIKFLFDRGIVNGTSPMTYSPDAPLTRAMAATILWRLENEPETEFRQVWGDVAEESWFAEAVIWAYDNGLIEPVDADSFAPMDQITTGELVMMLANYAEIEPEDFGYAGDLEALGAAIRATAAVVITRFMLALD